MSLVKVTVEVYENSKKKYTHQITYFEGQPYTVKIVTPDGTDTERSFIAGNESTR